MQMEFGLNVMPAIITAIIDAVLLKHVKSVYIDDIYINDDMVSAVHVSQHLADYGLTCKDWE